MHIPDHLVDVVRDLAEAYLERVSGDLRLIAAHRGPDHDDLVEARRRQGAAQELCDLFPPGRAAA